MPEQEQHARDRKALETLARAIYRNGLLWDYYDLDGAEQQDALEEAGLIERQIYDPAAHGDGIEADPGDEIFCLSDYGREILGVVK